MHGDDAAYYRRVGEWNARASYVAEVTASLDRLHLAPRARVLDLGCGTGTALALLSARELRVVGVDRSAAWAAACTERPVVRADGGALPFPAASLDAVVLIHSYAHLVAPAAVLHEIRRVLTGAGRLLLLTPNRRFVQALRPTSALRGYRPDATVERHRTLGELRAELRAADFEVVTATTAGRRPWLLPFGALRERLVVVAQPSR